MKKLVLVLLVLAFITCIEAENKQVEEVEDFDAELDELYDVVLQKFPFKIKLPKINFDIIKKKLGITKLLNALKHKKLFNINFRKLRLQLLKMKLPKIKIGPKTLNFIEKIAKGAGEGIKKLKELGLWEPLISLAKSYGLQKAAEICLKNLEDEEQCQKIIESIGGAVDTITGTGDKEE